MSHQEEHDRFAGSALGLFGKWKSESIPVIVIGYGDGFAVVFSGSILEVAPYEIVLARKGQTQEARSAQVTADLLPAQHFEYLDLREAPEDVKERWGGFITGTLAVHFPTSLWVFQELGGPAVKPSASA